MPVAFRKFLLVETLEKKSAGIAEYRRLDDFDVWNLGIDDAHQSAVSDNMRIRYLPYSFLIIGRASASTCAALIHPCR